jgi:hypothetical protein
MVAALSGNIHAVPAQLCAHRGFAEGCIVISKFGNYLRTAETCSATFLPIPAAFSAN